MLKNMNVCTMSHARALFRIFPIKQSSTFLYLNRLSDVVFHGKHESVQRLKTAVVETGETSSFRHLSTSTAAELQTPISTAIKRGRFGSSTSSELLTNGLRLPTSFTTTMCTQNVLKLSQLYPVVDGPNISSGIKLIEETDKRPNEYSGYNRVVAAGLRLSSDFSIRRLDSMTTSPVIVLLQWTPEYKLTAVECLREILTKTQKYLLSKSSPQSIFSPLAERKFSNNSKMDYDIKLRMKRNGNILSDKLKDVIHSRLFVATDEYLQSICISQSTTPTAKGCEYKTGCNVNKSMFTFRSTSLSSKTISDMLRPIQSKYGQSTIRNFSDTSSGSADEPPFGRVRENSSVGTATKKLTFSEEMYCLEMELKIVEREIKKVDDEIEYLETTIYWKAIFIIHNPNKMDYLVKKSMIEVQSKLLILFEKHSSVKRRMRKLLARSVPVRRIIKHQRVTWK